MLIEVAARNRLGCPSFRNKRLPLAIKRYPTSENETMPRHGQRPAQYDCDKGQQCTANSKRSGGRCRNYACQDRVICRMHGGTSKRGPEHWNYRTGEYSKDLRKARKVIGKMLHRPIEVRIAMYPEPFEEWAEKTLEGLRTGRRYFAVVNYLDGKRGIPLHEQERILKAARREISTRLRKVKAEMAGNPNEEE